MPITTTQHAAISDAERHRLFAQYVEPHLDAIRRLVAMTTPAGDDPDDNFQDILLRLFLKIEHYDPAAGPFEPWYRQVVRNFQRNRAQVFRLPLQTLTDFEPAAPLGPSALDTFAICSPAASSLAPAAAAAASPDAAAGPAAMEAPLAPSPSPVDPSPATPVTDASEFFSYVLTDEGERLTDEGERLAAALATLSARQRDVLLLVAQGWTVAAIARRLRLAPTAVSALLYRAREKMKTELKPRTFRP